MGIYTSYRLTVYPFCDCRRVSLHSRQQQHTYRIFYQYAWILLRLVSYTIETSVLTACRSLAGKDRTLRVTLLCLRARRSVPDHCVRVILLTSVSDIVTTIVGAVLGSSY